MSGPQPDVIDNTAAPQSAKPLPSGEALAKLLVDEGVITEKQLQHAQRIQAKLNSDSTLIGVIKKIGAANDEQICTALQAHQFDLPLGELLVELGYITAAQLKVSLEIQDRSEGRQKLGEILVAKKVIREQELVQILASRLGFRFIDLDISTCEGQLLDRVSPKACEQYGFVPVRATEEGVLVAFSDPLNQDARAAAEKALDSKIVPVTATVSALKAATVALGKRQRAVTPDNINKIDKSSPTGMVDAILLTAVRQKASDIHVEPMRDRVRVRFRCDGVLREFMDFSHEQMPAVTSRLKVLSEANIAERRRHQDGRIAFEDKETGNTIDMRASFYVTVHGEAIVLRILNPHAQLLDLESIGMLPKTLERFKYNALDAPSGVVIVTGPTGSGKTTTLYSCVHHLNNETTSIITAEDPVEIMVDGISQCSLNAKIDLTFEESLRHIVRQDPDVIVLGEIRDQFSAESAIQAALTGHKVLTTFHTEDSIGGLLRLLNMDIEAFLISSTVVCVVAQRLIRRVCGECAQEVEPTPRELQLVGWKAEDCQHGTFRKGEGCSHCHYTGYRGRVAVFEILVLNENVRDAILAHRTSAQIRRISVESSGLVTLLEDGLLKAARGETTLEEVRRTLPRLSKPRPLQEIGRLTGAHR